MPDPDPVLIAIWRVPWWARLGVSVVVALPLRRSAARRRLTRRVGVLGTPDTPMPVDSDI